MQNTCRESCINWNKMGHTNCWAILREDNDGNSILSNPQSPENHTNFHKTITFIDTDEGSLHISSCHDFIHSACWKV